MSCVRYLSSFTQSLTQLYNRYKIEAENSAKYIPPDGFFGIQFFGKIHT